MRAITVLQPWASLIACGEKRFETRGWGVRYRGPLAIHAGKDLRLAREWWSERTPASEAMRAALMKHLITTPDELPRGAVVAICRLVDVIPVENAWERAAGTSERYFGDFSHGRYAWDLVALDRVNVPARGKQGIWDWSER